MPSSSSLSAVLAGVKEIREAVERAQARRPQGAHDRLRRRGAPLQQGAAGRLPAARRVGPVHLHRRDHREPVVRGERGAAVAGHGACAATRWTPTTWRLLERARRARSGLRRSTTTARERLVGHADGDARRLLNAARDHGGAGRGVATPPMPPIDEARRSSDARENCAASTRAATQFYDQISALHKSVRGSTPMRRSTGSCACSTAAPTRATSPPHGAHGQRGHRAGRSARAAADARRRRGLRAAGLARGRTRARAGGGLPGRGAQEQRRLRRLQRGAGAGRQEDGTRPCRCTCATRPRADEVAGPRRGLPLRPRRARRLRRRRPAFKQGGFLA
jgi:cell division septum initiation protein DivIVA